jgi:chromosome segregation ATPase
LSTTISEQKA